MASCHSHISNNLFNINILHESISRINGPFGFDLAFCNFLNSHRFAIIGRWLPSFKSFDLTKKVRSYFFTSNHPHLLQQRGLRHKPDTPEWMKWHGKKSKSNRFDNRSRVHETFLQTSKDILFKPPNCHNVGVASSCHGRCPSQLGLALGTWCWC